MEKLSNKSLTKAAQALEAQNKMTFSLLMEFVDFLGKKDEFVEHLKNIKKKEPIKE
jgi:hypothetical protein